MRVLTGIDSEAADPHAARAYAQTEALLVLATLIERAALSARDTRLLMAHAQGQTWADVGRTIGISAASARSRGWRAIEKLRVAS
jgi:DNA-directed RNA polymerase sigma subunit (sigma70/sigma32)